MHGPQHHSLTTEMRSEPKQGLTSNRWELTQIFFLELLEKKLSLSTGFGKVVGYKPKEAGSHLGTNRVEHVREWRQRPEMWLKTSSEHLAMPGNSHIQSWSIYSLATSSYMYRFLFAPKLLFYHSHSHSFGYNHAELLDTPPNAGMLCVCVPALAPVHLLFSSLGLLSSRYFYGSPPTHCHLPDLF